MLKDSNAAVPVDYCPRCGGEIYDGEEYCTECRERSRRKTRCYDQSTVDDMMEEVDWQLQKYLSDDLRHTVWNVLAEKFKAEEV